MTETLEQVEEAGRKRLYPSITNPNWLVLQKRRELFRRWLRDALPEKPMVLDVGGRIQPYRSLLPQGSPYFAVDLRATPLVNCIAQAERLPFLNDRFDLVLCTQMLEYAPEPACVISEIYRVLRRGGTLLLSVPTVFPRDADEDRWRFLPGAIRDLLSNFVTVEVIAEGSSIVGLFRSVSVCCHIFAKYAVVRKALSYTLIPVLNIAGWALEESIGSSNDVFAANYSVRARK
jgi:SAM-dependent methyltransferase